MKTEDMQHPISTPQRMLHNTVAYMAAGMIPNVINLAILPLYARHVEPADYGLVSLVVAFTTFLGTVLGLQLSNSVHRLYFDYEGEERKVYLSSMLVSIVTLNIVILLSLHAAGPWLTSTLFPKVELPYRPLMMLGFVLLFGQSLINYGNSVLRVQERGRALLFASVAHTLSSVALGIYFVVLQGWGARGLLTAMAGSAAVHVVLHAWMLRRQLYLRFRWDMVRGAAAYSIPIIPHSLGGLLFMYSDKYVASFFVPVGMIGLYEFGDKITMVFKLLVQSFYHAISPNFMRDSLQDRAATVVRYKGIITRWSAIYAILYLCMALLSKELVEVLFPARFHGCYPFIPILAGAYLFRGLYLFAIDAVLFEKKTWLIPLVSLSAGLFNVVANIVLMPRFGMIVAAWTTLIAFAMTFVFAVCLSRYIYPIQYDWGSLTWIFAGMLGVLWLGYRVDTGVWWWDAIGKIGIITLYALWILWRNYGGMRAWLGQWICFG